MALPICLAMPRLTLASATSEPIIKEINVGSLFSRKTPYRFHLRQLPHRNASY